MSVHWQKRCLSVFLIIFLVALNFQTPGQMLDLYDGRFRQNGGCGYVLKPSVMRDPVTFFPSSHIKGGIIPGLAPQILRLKVFLLIKSFRHCRQMFPFKHLTVWTTVTWSNRSSVACNFHVREAQPPKARPSTHTSWCRYTEFLPIAPKFKQEQCLMRVRNHYLPCKVHRQASSWVRRSWSFQAIVRFLTKRSNFKSIYPS